MNFSFKKEKKEDLTPAVKQEQLNESNECIFCGGKGDHEHFNQKEKMIAYIASIKSSRYGEKLTPEGLGWLISIMRQLYCPSITLDECRQFVHDISALKKDYEEKCEKMVRHQFQSSAQIETARNQFIKDHKLIFLANDPNCSCKCHKEGKTHCMNCSFDEYEGVWHLGLEDKNKFMEYSISKRFKL
jgi:hypothetical protein